MRERLPIVLSATALVVALLGTTPLGRAAGSAIQKGVPFAKRAGFASNAGKLNGHKSSPNPGPGQIPVVGPNGLLPDSIGAVGAPGPAGVSGYEQVVQQVSIPAGPDKKDGYDVACPGKKSVLGAGYDRSKAPDTRLEWSQPISSSAWSFQITNTTGAAGKPVTLYVICANVG